MNRSTLGFITVALSMAHHNYYNFESLYPPTPRTKGFINPEAWDTPTRRKTGQCIRKTAKIGRNETCPCGSGMKFKKCCINEPLKKNH